MMAGGGVCGVFAVLTTAKLHCNLIEREFYYVRGYFSSGADSY